MIHLTALLLQVAGATPASGDALIAQMHDRWNGKWATTRTFVQRTEVPGKPDEIWYESEQAGMLRIDVAPIDSMNSSVMRNDSLYAFRKGVARPGRPYANVLGVLLVDVYTQPAAVTIAKLQAAGMDFSKIRADNWNGQQVWVVGAAPGDTLSPQFWVDQKQLLLVRVFDRLGPNTLLDGRVTARLAGKIPVESAMVFYIGGKEVQREFYNEIKLNVTLEPEVFDNAKWYRPSWIPKSP